MTQSGALPSAYHVFPFKCMENAYPPNFLATPDLQITKDIKR